MIGKLRGRSRDELVQRGSALAATLLERAGWNPDGREPDAERLAKLLPSVGPARLLEAFRAGPAPLLPGLIDPAATAAYVRREWPAEAAELVARADRIVSGRFDLLGHRDLDFGDPIDWQLDPLLGRRAPLVHWSRLRYLDPSQVGDHKVVWELNRHQHFVTLGQAWALTGDERYAETLLGRMNRWMDANPPKRGMNWASALEVGFRAISWLVALRLVRHSPALTPPRFARALGMLHVHARHLEVHLSTWFSPNTHLTGEALALVYLGAGLPELRAAQRWLGAGRAVLLRELGRQLHPDGVYFEQSSYYHRYTVDFYLHLALILETRGEALAEEVRGPLERALDYLVALVRPDGTSSLVGDDDGGRLMVLNSRPANDFRDTVGLGGAVLGGPEYCFAAGPLPVEAAWLLGPGAGERYRAAGARQPPASVLFPDGGHAIMRSAWREDADWLRFDCGPQGAFGHAHADALAFELVVEGRPVLEDAGTFTYVTDPALRERFRGGTMHNSVTLAGESSALSGGPFRWAAGADASITAWTSTPDLDFAGALHHGFWRFSPAATHRREVLFLKPWSCWVVRDRIDSPMRRPFSAHFHAAPGIAIQAVGEFARFAGEGRGDLMLSAWAAHLELSVRESWHSPVYGVRVPAQALDIAVTGGNELVTVLAAAGASGIPFVLNERRDEGHRVRVGRGSAGVEITIAGNEWRVDGAVLSAGGA